MTIKSDRELSGESQNQLDVNNTDTSSQESNVQKSSSDWRWILVGAMSPLLLGLIGFGIYTAVTPKPVPVNIIVEAPASKPPTSNIPSTSQNSLLPASLSASSPTKPIPSPSMASTTSPEDLVRKYYNDIKIGRYQDSWNMLPSDMQKDSSLHPNGYASFTEWWTKTSVDVNGIQLAAQSDRDAVVNVDITFNVSRSGSRPLHFRYFFTKDLVSNSWTISKIKLR
jgi:hypothetical protein